MQEHISIGVTGWINRREQNHQHNQAHGRRIMFKISKVFSSLQSIKDFFQTPCNRDFATDVCSLRRDTFNQNSNFEGYDTVQTSTTPHVLVDQVSERSFGV